MGNRDKRWRETRKPKKKEIKQPVSTKRAPEYKPTTPVAEDQSVPGKTS